MKIKHIFWAFVILLLFIGFFNISKDPVFTFLIFFSELLIIIGMTIEFGKNASKNFLKCIFWLFIAPFVYGAICSVLPIFILGTEASSHNKYITNYIGLIIYPVVYLVLWFFMAILSDLKTVKISFSIIAGFTFIIDRTITAIVDIVPLKLISKGVFSIIFSSGIKVGIEPQGIIKAMCSFLILPFLYLSITMLIVIVLRESGKFDWLIRNISYHVDNLKYIFNKRIRHYESLN